MSIPLRVIDDPWPGEYPHAYYFDRDVAQPGDMWRVPTADADGREAWAIVLPRPAGIWLTTSKAGGADGRMWEVTGEPPNITVNPSIHEVGAWHGWIRDGVLVDV